MSIIEPTERYPTEFGTMTDEEIIALAQGDGKLHQAALEYLVTEYAEFVEMKARSYFLIGGERDDVVQEGMIGLYKAIRDFRPEKKTSFRSFADLCITRQIITAVKAATRQKHRPLNSYVSLDKPVYDDESSRTLLSVLNVGDVPDPGDLMISREELDGLEQYMSQHLSELEWRVLVPYLEGKSYKRIADEVGCHVKSVDNALQRGKNKLEQCLLDLERQDAEHEPPGE